MLLFVLGVIAGWALFAGIQMCKKAPPTRARVEAEITKAAEGLITDGFIEGYKQGYAHGEAGESFTKKKRKKAKV